MPGVIANTVEICLFRFRKDHPEYLLLKRSLREHLYPGLWQVVTGSVHPGEKGIDAAFREVREETGLRPALFWVVPTINGFYDPAEDRVSLIPCFAGQVHPDEDPVLSEEHETFEWLTLDHALPRIVWPGQKRVLEMVHRSIVGGEMAGLVTLVPPESFP
jgi:dATP pyrophosphohydrolase